MTLVATARRQVTARRLAQASILLEIVIIARTLGEVYRLRAEQGAAFTFDAAMAWLTGALIALAFLAAGALLHFAGHNRLAIATAVVLVATLIVYKAIAIGLG
jgi:hypothetical protein